MKTRALWMVMASIASAGCLTTGASGYGDGENNDGVDLPDDTTPEWTCPAYPTDGTIGTQVDNVISPDFSLPGNGPGNEGAWTMGEFWCMANAEENPATVLIMDVHSMTCSYCLQTAAPRMQDWHEQYGDQGLVAFGVSIQESPEAAQSYWEGELQHTHPWAADPGFQTGSFSPDSTIGTPAFLVVDLTDMTIRHWQEGLGTTDEQLFTPYLR